MIKINVIGGGLAGVEASYALANFGYKVDLYEQKPVCFSEAHVNENMGELVCSNSLKSNSLSNACGLLKEEMRHLNSLTMEAANIASIPSGQALSVDREKFAEYITSKIVSNSNINVIRKKVNKLPEGINLICTGPLTDGDLAIQIKNIIGEDYLGFFDAASPIIDAKSLDISKMYEKSRYDKGDGGYLNCPMNKEQYLKFYEELIKAEVITKHDFDHFEACLPIEVIAKREVNAMRFGPLKPQGLEQNGQTHYAVVQLRQENNFKSLYEIVGFQTNLKYGEQKRVFSLIPGLENATFTRYGLMHRNSFICAPKVLNRNLSLKNNKNVYILGQLSGVEGYVESAAMGLLGAYYVNQSLKEKAFEPVPLETMMGSLVNYLVMANSKSFAPMNANYGIFYNVIKDKEELAKRSLALLDTWKEQQC